MAVCCKILSARWRLFQPSCPLFVGKWEQDKGETPKSIPNKEEERRSKETKEWREGENKVREEKRNKERKERCKKETEIRER